jgi:FMN phosphatase YigB (HAD superfamily)
MYIKNILLTLLFLSVQLASASIMQSSFISVVADHVKSQDTLVIFDLDDTVCHIPGSFVNDAWFTNMINHAKHLGHDDEGALQTVIPHFEQRMNQVTVVDPVEIDTVGVIHSLQQKGIPVIAMTARSTMVAQSTLEQLSSIGVDFSKTSITPYDISFALKHPAVLCKGVMFCASNSKGDGLKALLNTMAIPPKKIVFVDDKEKYLRSVMQAAIELGIEFVGIHYAHLAEKVKQFVLDDESKALLVPPAQKIIVEHDSIEAIKDYLIPGCMAIFDVDDTLLHIDHPTEFGSNKWINHMMFYGKKDFQLTREELEPWVIPMYLELQHSIPFKPVEEATAGVIQELQQTGVPVLGLTARRLELIDITIKNLRDMGIDFSLSSAAKEPTSFAINHPNIFINGIMFCGGSRETEKIGNQTHAKDRAIKALIKHFNMNPTRVIVVDDRHDYLESIVSTIVSMGIDCVGIRYSRSDERLSCFVLDDQSRALLANCAEAKTQQK